MLFNGDLLDEYCDSEFGHSDWKMDFDADGNQVITFFKDPRPEYLADLEAELEEEEDEEITSIDVLNYESKNGDEDSFSNLDK